MACLHHGEFMFSLPSATSQFCYLLGAVCIMGDFYVISKKEEKRNYKNLRECQKISSPAPAISA